MGGGRGPPKLSHSLLHPHTPAQQEGIGTRLEGSHTVFQPFVCVLYFQLFELFLVYFATQLLSKLQ